MSNFLKSVLTFEQGYRMWSFIFLTAIVEILLVVGTYMNWHLRQIPWLVGFTFLAFLLAFISHLNFTQTPKRIIVLVLYFAFTGFMIDAVLINTEQFHFNIKSIYIFNTPVTQIFGWFFMFYMVFSTSSSVGMMLNGGTNDCFDSQIPNSTMQYHIIGLGSSRSKNDFLRLCIKDFSNSFSSSFHISFCRPSKGMGRGRISKTIFHHFGHCPYHLFPQGRGGRIIKIYSGVIFQIVAASR